MGAFFPAQPRGTAAFLGLFAGVAQETNTGIVSEQVTSSGYRTSRLKYRSLVARHT